MPYGFSRKWNPVFHERIQRLIKILMPLNRQRVQAVTKGLTMPDITAVTIGSAKRMTASVMFFDLKDFTTTTSRLPNEHTLYMLNLIIPTVMRAITQWRGVIEKNTGDGVMAIFGTETRDESIIATEAFECAMAIKFIMLNDIRPVLENHNLPAMNFRIGIDMGEVLLARIGIVNDSFLTAVGSAANRAAKLQSLADTNGICIGDNLFQNLPSVVDGHCMVGENESWRWAWAGDNNMPYNFYHFSGNLPEPKNWISR
jgi:adenylate cyclase